MPSLYYKNDSTWEQIQLVSFPVGAIYMSYTSTSPASFIGGSWTRIKDTFLLAAGSTYSATNTGGEAEHTLTVEEMPSHNHSATFETVDSPAFSGRYAVVQTRNVEYQRYQNETSNTGGNKPHNNMPPYLVVYIWRRTA